MASPPRVHSPAAMSPPFSSPAPSIATTKKRSSAHDMSAPAHKRRKGSLVSQASGASHPLRQTSFPPEATSGSPYPRSPSVDAASHVSGSVASAGGRRKRGSRARVAAGGEKTPSLVGGRAPTTTGSASAAGGAGAGGGAGDKEVEEDEDEEKAEMALEDVVARTQEQKQEEIRLRAMLVEAFDGEQYNRYELWRAAKLSDAVVKRVVNATVSQSVPQMVATAVKAVAKLFAGEIIEAARQVQDEWILAGERQSELPSPSASTASPTDAGGDDTEQDDSGGDKKKKEEEEEEQEEEADLKRGPMRPDHLREAWRRYKMCGESQGVGVQQLWQTQQGTGVGRFSTRTRTRLFR